MIKNKFVLLIFSATMLTACSSVNSGSIENIFSANQIPNEIKETVASRVNPEAELYAIAASTLSKNGAVVAQSQAYKDASINLKNQIKKEVESLYESYLNNMDPFSRNIVSPSISNLISYVTDYLINKKTTQKGAWEDNTKIYSLLTVPRADVTNVAENFFKKFIDDTTKRLSSFGSNN